MRPAGRAAHTLCALALGIASAGFLPGAAPAAPMAPGTPPQGAVVFAADELGGGVSSAPLDTGGPAVSAAPDQHHSAPAGRPPRFVAVDAATVYYTVPGPSGGVYAATDGGRTRIAALPGATGVGLDGPTVYAVTRHGVLHAYPGGAAPGTATRLNVPATANIQGITVDDGTMYLADWADRAVYAAHPGKSDVRLVAGAHDGLQRPVDVVADGTALYVTELAVDGARTGRISRISRTGTAARTTLADGLDIPTGLALAGRSLYVAEGGADRILALDTTGQGTPRPVVTEGLDGPWGIAVRAPAGPGAGARGELPADRLPGFLGSLAQSVGLVR